ncbi:hypothetical protein KJ940_21325 [Myxococcota bacterium]|nr:hypothetical protein [Myxococcota bacterium]
MKYKKCSICKKELPLDRFYRQNHYVKSGYRAACKSCELKRKQELDLSKGVKRKRDPIKERVRRKTRAALKKGLLSKKSHCERCSRAIPLQAHHPSYEGKRPHLTVIWLCQGCHAKEHGTRDWNRQGEFRFPDEDFN